MARESRKLRYFRGAPRPKRRKIAIRLRAEGINQRKNTCISEGHIRPTPGPGQRSIKRGKTRWFLLRKSRTGPKSRFNAFLRVLERVHLDPDQGEERSPPGPLAMGQIESKRPCFYTNPCKRVKKQHPFEGKTFDCRI